MREMRELLEEARKEAEKHEPHMVKLRALPIDRKKIAQTFAALDPMWQDGQPVTRMIGTL